MGEIMNEIQSLISNRYGVELPHDAPMFENGIDSIDFIELIIEIEEKYNIEFDLDVLIYDELNNIKDLSLYIFSKINGDIGKACPTISI